MPTSPIARQQRAPTVAIGRRRSRQSRSSGWASNLARLLEDSSIKQVSPSVAPGQPIPPPWPLCSRRFPRLALGADCGLGADTGRSGGAKRLESEPQKRKALLTLPFINAVPSAANHRSNPSVQARNRISGDAIMGAPNSVETALRKDPVSFRAPVRTLTLLTRIR